MGVGGESGRAPAAAAGGLPLPATAEAEAEAIEAEDFTALALDAVVEEAAEAERFKSDGS